MHTTEPSHAPSARGVTRTGRGRVDGREYAAGESVLPTAAALLASPLRHAEALAVLARSARAARARVLAVDPLGPTLPGGVDERTRVVLDAPGGLTRYVVLTTSPSESPTLDYPGCVFPVPLLLDGSLRDVLGRVQPEGASNADVVEVITRVAALRGTPGVDALLGHRSLGRGAYSPEVASAAEVDAALGGLRDLAHGAPLGWVLRRLDGERS